MKKILLFILAVAITAAFTPAVPGLVSTASAASLAAPATFYGGYSKTGNVKLKWSKASHASKYVIYKNGKRYKTVKGISYTDKKIKKGRTYKYQLRSKTTSALSKKTYSISVKAKKGSNVTKVKMSETSLALLPDKSAALKASLTPAAKIVSSKVTWGSSNSSVAKVSSAGAVTSAAVGSCKITARAHDGVTGSCTVNVTSTQVATPSGTYLGTTDKNGVEQFLGIRYSSPVKRWQAPSDVTTSSSDVINATQWGPSCTQPYDEVEEASQYKLSEDCLNLNVWTKNTDTKNKPVIVFIHGGGFMNGGSHDSLYTGNNFINDLSSDEDAVYISINYRTNLFGSLDLSWLPDYDKYSAGGKYKDALDMFAVDQAQALKWVSENASSFGGNAKDVTVMGQSCGGMSIAYMLANPDVNKYFQKAIIESGAPFIASCSKAKKTAVSKMVCKTLGVTTMKQLLSKKDTDINNNSLGAKNPLKEIFDNMGGLSDNYFTDSTFVSKDWWDKIKAGSAKNIKVMIGCCNGENDWAAYDYDNMPNTLKSSTDVWNNYVYSDVVSTKGGDKARYLLNPCTSGKTVNSDVKNYLAQGSDKVLQMTDLYNDTCYVQGTEYLAEALSKYADTYLYNWQYAPEPSSVIAYDTKIGVDPEVSPYGRAQHCMDLIFATGNTKDGYPQMSGDPAKLPSSLAPMTEATWYAFAKNGDPNNAKIPTWKKYDTTDRETMVMGQSGKNITLSSEWNLKSDPRAKERKAFIWQPQDVSGN